MPQHIWKLTPREAAAQCIMPRLVPNSIQESDSSKQEIMSLIAQGIGGFCVFQGDVEYTATLIDELQKEIKDLRNIGLLSLTFNVGFVMSVFVSLMWGSYITN